MSKKYPISYAELQRRLAQQRREILAQQEYAIVPEAKSMTVSNGFFVGNWRQGWRWFSSWAFMLIVFIATVPIPQAFLDVLSDDVRQIVVAVVAVVGWVLRFINQTTPLHEVNNDDSA